MNSGTKITPLLIQYTSCLQKAATEEKWADVQNLLMHYVVRSYSVRSVQKVCNS